MHPSSLIVHILTRALHRFYFDVLSTTLMITLSAVVPGLSGHSVSGPAGGDAGEDSPQTDGCSEGHWHPALEAQPVGADRDQPGPDYVHMEDVRQEVRLFNSLPPDTHLSVVFTYTLWELHAQIISPEMSHVLTHGITFITSNVQHKLVLSIKIHITS